MSDAEYKLYKQSFLLSLFTILYNIMAIMVLRTRKNPESPRSVFEKSALRVTGSAFYLLSAGLIAGIVINVINFRKPETTFWGIVISLISIVFMIWLLVAKRRVGKTHRSRRTGLPILQRRQGII